MNTNKNPIIAASKYIFSLSVLLIFSASASASSYGTFVGTFTGNDSASALFVSLGVEAELIARVDDPETSNDGLTLVATEFNEDNETLAGEWIYAGSEIITHLVIKSGNQYSVFLYLDGLNTGLFETLQTGGMGMSHVTVYSAAPVPIPGAIWLLGTGLLAIFGLRKD